MPPSKDPDLTPIDPYHVPLLPDFEPGVDLLVAHRAPSGILTRRGAGRKGARLDVIPWQSTPDQIVAKWGAGPFSFSLRDVAGRVIREEDDVLGDPDAEPEVVDALPEEDFAAQYWRGRPDRPRGSAGDEDLRGVIADLRAQVDKLTAPPDPIDLLAAQVAALAESLPGIVEKAVAERVPAALPAPAVDPREELRATLATMRDFGVLPSGEGGGVGSRVGELKDLVEMVALVKGLNGDVAGWEKGVADLPNAVRDVVLGLKYGPDWYDDEEEGEEVDEEPAAGGDPDREEPAPKTTRPKRFERTSPTPGDFKLGDLRGLLQVMPNGRAVGFTLAEMVEVGTIQEAFLSGSVLKQILSALGDDALAAKGAEGAKVARALIKRRAAKAAG